MRITQTAKLAESPSRTVLAGEVVRPQQRAEAEAPSRTILAGEVSPTRQGAEAVSQPQEAL
jgi:hypothetical protein